MAPDLQATRVLLVLVLVLCSASELVVDGAEQLILPLQNSTLSSRKLFSFEVNSEHGKLCRRDDIELSQAQVPGVSGIPAYLVQLTNLCSDNCTMYNVHISCGSFSSVHLINPKVFKRIGYDDCLLNAGGDFKAGDIVSFKYYTSIMYPLSVASVSCR